MIHHWHQLVFIFNQHVLNMAEIKNLRKEKMRQKSRGGCRTNLLVMRRSEKATVFPAADHAKNTILAPCRLDLKHPHGVSVNVK
ncbi:MAG: hypothetical protein HY360_00305 [Verrucomicrobia bacterium]|nr:hypothetical protein [Verrucomicrobiota bacterium]